MSGRGDEDQAERTNARAALGLDSCRIPLASRECRVNGSTKINLDDYGDGKDRLLRVEM